jgi:hypothetical protein
LVHTCPLFDGIRARLLAPFHYFGILDESVDYRAVPWRNGRFDQSFAREDIPALFGEAFNPGSWNVGHVVLNQQKAHILLVTLNKQGKAEAHRYLDHWIDAHTFHLQSQNSTTPESKRGQELIQHAARGIAIHLFVRDSKLAGGKGAPFVYHGRVSYQSHQGSGPMSVVWRV